LLAFVVIALVAGTVWADEITDWNQTMLRAALVGGTSPPVATRVAAIVQAAVFDAVNGIARRYTPIHVEPAGPAGASQDAAAVQAAYATLVQHPRRKHVRRQARRLAGGPRCAHEDGAAIGRAGAEKRCRHDPRGGRRWLHAGAAGFLGGTAVGQWRPTPPAFASGAVPQFAYMTPWVIAAPSQFRPAGPPALTSARYAKDFNETKTMGHMLSSTRTPDQTVYAWFWASATPSFLFNTVAVSLLGDSSLESEKDDDRDSHAKHHDSTLQNARLLAQLNVAIADAAIACYEAKYTYVFWRPVTAIPLAATDDNPATSEDPTWMPLLATPAHPEYPSGHSCLSAAAVGVLADRFGEKTHFTLESDLMPGVVRSFKSFSSALEEVKNARIFAGIHFRSATDDGEKLGASVAEYVLDHAAQPLR
jgi:membrane-associated phospholipid phosphatase